MTAATIYRQPLIPSVPQRLKRERKQGWRKPPGSVIVDRTSRWGNPYKVGVDAQDNAEAVELYKQHLADHPELVAEIRRQLRGMNLICFCPLDQACHGDTLLEIANAPGLPAAAEKPPTGLPEASNQVPEGFPQ